ncbi:hypothetical protein CcaCcLH18_06229 [Colletotrichum camelliae]|nr:hypothetical protein CcaCcLH18_06229 [Colletotrichum camelliae]
MPTSLPHLYSFPAEKRREVWLQWALSNINPVFEKFPGERAYVVFQLENLEWTKGTHLPPANSDSDAWCRLKQTWASSEPPPRGTIPSVADCEVVRLLNKGYIHEYIELNLRKHGWDPRKCCNPSLKIQQKRLNAPSPAKPSPSAGTPTPTSTDARSSVAASSSTTAPASKTTGTGVPTSGATTGELRDRLIRAMSRWKRACYRWTGWLRFWTWRPVTKASSTCGDYSLYASLAEADNFFPFHAPDKCASEPERWFRIHYTPEACPNSPKGSRADIHIWIGADFFPSRTSQLDQVNGNSCNRLEAVWKHVRRRAELWWTAFNTSVSEEGVSGTKNAVGSSAENQTKCQASPGHQAGNSTVGKHNTPSRGVPSSSKPVVSSEIPVSGNKGTVGARVITNHLRALNPPNTLQHQFNPYMALEEEAFLEDSRDLLFQHISFQFRAWSADEVRLADYNAHAERKAINLANKPTAKNTDSGNEHERIFQSHNSRSQPAAEREYKTQSPASKNLQPIVTPKEEHLSVNDDLQKNDIERMSAKIFKSCRTILYAYLRGEIESISKAVMGNMKKCTVEVLGRQSNSHLGFTTLRDVEDHALAMMEAEINSARKAALEQIDKLDKHGSGVPIKREASELEEGGVTEQAQEAKRQRTSNSAHSQDCVQS